jgi:hypothetical protein
LLARARVFPQFLNLNVASDLDRLLARLHANKAELLKVLDSSSSRSRPRELRLLLYTEFPVSQEGHHVPSWHTSADLRDAQSRQLSEVLETCRSNGRHSHF